MIPGEIICKDEKIEVNAGREVVVIHVINTGERPIQVGSHYHFYEVNSALQFDREKARGMRLDIEAGTARRFEPGPDDKLGVEVRLVPFVGARIITGFRGDINGKL